MAGEASSNEVLRRAVEAIKSSDVVESRTELISGLGDLVISKKCDICFLFENLIAFWEDFTCLDVSQCTLNKSIVQVASNYVVSGKSGVLSLFLVLGTKASLWSRKHFKMTIMSMEDSHEEEHSKVFYQLLLDVLNFSAASFSAPTDSYAFEENNLVGIVENSILEQLALMKDLLEHITRLESYGSEVLKVSQLVIDSIIRFCGEQCQAKSWDSFSKNPDKEGIMDCEGTISVNPIINIRKYAIQRLCELGTVAAKGGHLVSILNTSWKGVVTLLQQDNGSLEAVLDVSDIILKLISLANHSLRSAAESWSSSLKEPISVAVARRTFVPVKFYLVNAVKISSFCPTQAFLVHREIILCVMMISSFRVSLSTETNLKIASEVSSELLEQMSMSLLYSILNPDEVEEQMKFEIMDRLFTSEGCHSSSQEDPCGHNIMQMEKIFSLTCDSISCTKTLILGRVLLFMCLLRSSIDAEENVKIVITRKLGWLFNMLIDEEVYACILSMQIPLSHGTKQKTQFVWEPMFLSLLESLKTFMIAASSSLAWGELVSFLLDNIFHPHLLCWEIVMELLCFLMRYAEKNVASSLIDKLCSCFKSVACLGSILDPNSAVRKIARSISMLVKCGAQPVADRVHSSLIGGDRSQLSSVMLVALLMEGFSLQLLSDNFREIVRKRIITDYCGFIETFHGKLLGACGSSLFGAPVFALSASLPSLQVNESGIDKKTLQFLFAILGTLSESSDTRVSYNCHRLLAETLGIFSHMNGLYKSNEMEAIILQLHKLFISKAASDTQQQRSKAELALFMAGFGHMDMSETEECKKGSAVCGLYHMLLRERHWALIHLAIASFGYFAARSSCNQLWRFVPDNAALSYDILGGYEVSEERFMCEFKAFLEKERALPELAPSSEQILLLQEEAALLKEAVRKKIQTLETEEMDCEVVEIDHEQLSSKRRKMPDGISKGVELLQSGLKVIGEGLSQWQKTQPNSLDLHDKLLTHFSCLEDAITNLASIAGSGSN
ncbi:uncharacterized protein LOC116196600 isoform X1 [Punica granatum]|uniref:Uncharacterized protein LOC116196600 isoform X1 n=2 Tax=Punica granatum TaxID=22663 RepID=A0A6P8CIJ0_PUNGR|nr:uncharacterized protein LOC116196600 isoform X1 [Punica granatum]